MATIVQSTSVSGSVTSPTTSGVPQAQVVGLTDGEGKLLGTAAAPLVTSSSASTPDISATGTIAGTTSVTLALSGQGAATIQIVPTSLVGTLAFEASNDGGTTWIALAVWPVGSTATGNLITGVTNPGSTVLYETNVAAMSHVRVRGSAYTSGSAAITVRGGLATSAVVLDGPLPTGSNTIGAITGTGAAGTPATGVVTVQGIASGTVVPVSISNSPAVFAVGQIPSNVYTEAATAGRTSNGNTSTWTWSGGATQAFIGVNVTAFTGGTNVVVSLQQQDANGQWQTVASSAAITGTGVAAFSAGSGVGGSGSNMIAGGALARIAWTVTGTFSALTFQVGVQAR